MDHHLRRYFRLCIPLLIVALLFSAITVFAHPSVSDPSSNVPPRQDQPANVWYAWIFDRDADQLILISADGVQDTISRPQLPNEAADSFPAVSFSRDSRFAVIRATLTNNNIGVGIYDVGAGRLVQTHQAQANERVFMPSNGLNFDPDSEYVAVAFANVTDTQNPTWRIDIFETETGTIITSLDNTSPLLTFASTQPQFPNIRLLDTDGSLHVQLWPFGGQLPEQVPAFIWHTNPFDSSVEASPFTQIGAAILPTTGEAVWAGFDNSQTSLPSINQIPSYNAIIVGAPDGSTTSIWVDSTRIHTGAKWAADGLIILFQTTTDNETYQNVAYNVQRSAIVVLNADVVFTLGTPNGFLTQTSTGVIQAHSLDNPALGQTVWQTDPNADFQLLWTMPPGATFGLSSGVNVLAPSGPAASPTTIPPIDATVVTDRLNVRAQPGTGAAILDVVLRDQTVNIIGRLPDSSWMQVQTEAGVVGWVSTQFLNVSVDLNTIPIVDATVNNPPTAPAVSGSPTSQFFSDSNTIVQGDCATLSWTVTNPGQIALQVTLNDVPVALSGTQVVCPTTTTTYRLHVIVPDDEQMPAFLTITVLGGY